jgi:hypothetical protein
MRFRVAPESLARGEAKMKHRKRAMGRIAVQVLAVLYLICGWSAQANAGAMLLHTYANFLGLEVTPLVAVGSAKLTPLLPSGYSMVPAAAFGVGGSDQGLVAMVNFEGLGQATDHGAPHDQVAIDIAVLVAEPAMAASAGLSIPGAFHLYTLAIYTNDARYAASLRDADMPVEFVDGIGYARAIDDASGVGDLTVTVPSDPAALKTAASALGYSPAPGALNAIFWYAGSDGTVALHYHGEPFRQGNAIAEVSTQPGSKWEALLAGGGLGPCPSDPDTGFSCISAPALNFRYDDGTEGRLLLISAVPEPPGLGLLSIGWLLLAAAARNRFAVAGTDPRRTQIRHCRT